MLTTSQRTRSDDRLTPLILGAGLQAAIDDVIWAAAGLAGELDVMIRRREGAGTGRTDGTACADGAAQVAAAAALLPQRP